MDPNETLRRMRELVAWLNDGEIAQDAMASEMAELFQALDEWLSRGGFLPDAWKRNE